MSTRRTLEECARVVAQVFGDTLCAARCFMHVRNANAAGPRFDEELQALQGELISTLEFVARSMRELGALKPAEHIDALRDMAIACDFRDTDTLNALQQASYKCIARSS